jgi:hypothetical protein
MRRFTAAVGKVLLVVRWWFGVTYVLGGVGGIIASPIMVATGHPRGLLLLIGFSIIFALGWVVHPWGLQRTGRREAQGYDRGSALLPSRWASHR